MKNLNNKINDCAVDNKRTRQSNFELARIFSMVLVLILHSTYSALGWPEEVGGIFCGRLLAESLAIVGVNVFVLISGYFSIEPKLKSIKNFIFICLFYGIFSMIYHLLIGEFSIRNVFFVSSGNWFVVSYIGLLIFAPFLNSLINSNIRWGGVLLALIIYECWFGFFPQFNYVDPGINNGYSLLHLVIIYLIGRYIKINDVPSFLRKCPLLIYLFLGVLLSAFIVAVYIISETHSITKEVWLTKLYGYCNPIIILMSVCLFLFFEKMKLNNSVFVNHIAKSMLPTLLIHTTVFWNVYLDIFKSINEKFNGPLVVALWIISIITILLICILIDQIRIVVYNFISNKRILLRNI